MACSLSFHHVDFRGPLSLENHLGDSEARRVNFFFAKGRVALYAILKAAGLGSADEVIIPGYTCVAVPQAVIHAGAKPVYADVETDTYALDVPALANKITKRTKVIILQHTYGIPADVEQTLALAQEAGVMVVEDCCHSLGSQYKGKDLGRFGDAAFFSSQWSKPVTTGLGGWAVINNRALARRMSRVYRNFAPPARIESALLRAQVTAYRLAFKPKWFWALRDAYRYLGYCGIVVPSSTREELDGQRPGDYAKTMAGWQRQLLQKRLSHIGPAIAHRQRVAGEYEDLLRKLQRKTVTASVGAAPVFLRYPLQLSNKDLFLSEARRRRVEIGDWFVSPVHPLMDQWDRAGYQAGSCPRGEWLSNHVVNLPTHQGIGQEETRQIGSLIEQCAN